MTVRAWHARWARRLAVPAMLAAAVAVCSAPARPARAADPAVAIVIDFQTVVRNSAAAQAVQRQIDEVRQSYQDEFGAIEEDLRELEAELTAQRNVMPPDRFVERRREFEQRVTEAQREAQVRRAELDEALNTAMDRIRDELVAIVAEIAEEQGANVVLNRSQVILFDQSLEFSEEALERLDEALPSIELDAPEAP
jgi:Skp family chaperone for outer membrane proteins